MSTTGLPLITALLKQKSRGRPIFAITVTRPNPDGEPATEILRSLIGQPSPRRARSLVSIPQPAPGSLAEELEKRISLRLDMQSLTVAEDVARRLEPALDRKPVLPRLLTFAEAGVYIGRSRGAVEEMVRAGKLPSVSCDRRKHIDRHDLDRWIDQNRVG